MVPRAPTRVAKCPPRGHITLAALSQENLFVCVGRSMQQVMGYPILFCEAARACYASFVIRRQARLDGGNPSRRRGWNSLRQFYFQNEESGAIGSPIRSGSPHGDYYCARKP